MYCTNCGAAIEQDSKFCRQCGQKISEPKQLCPEDHLKIGELVYAAYKHQEVGSIDDAIFACQGALALNERSPQAHALLGSLYESKGDFVSAAREYARAVELDPENEVNCRKLEDLKSGRVVLASQPREDGLLEKLKPYIPYASAAAVLLIILVFGMSLVQAPAGESKPNTGSRDQLSAGQSVIPQVAVPAQQDTQPQTNPNQGQPPATATQTANTQKPGITPVPLPRTQPVVSSPRSGNQPSEPPVIVPVIETSRNTPTPTPRANPPADSEVIRYTPSPATQPQMDPEEKGLQLQRAGKYRDAITAYREATTKTNDSGRVYQQIALCYQRLGENDMAVDSYNRAINSYKKQLSAGRDTAEVQRNIRACEAGIKVSQGN